MSRTPSMSRISSGRISTGSPAMRRAQVPFGISKARRATRSARARARPRRSARARARSRPATPDGVRQSALHGWSRPGRRARSRRRLAVRHQRAQLAIAIDQVGVRRVAERVVVVRGHLRPRRCRSPCARRRAAAPCRCRRRSSGRSSPGTRAGARRRRARDRPSRTRPAGRAPRAELAPRFGKRRRASSGRLRGSDVKPNCQDHDLAAEARELSGAPSEPCSPNSGAARGGSNTPARRPGPSARDRREREAGRAARARLRAQSAIGAALRGTGKALVHVGFIRDRCFAMVPASIESCIRSSNSERITDRSP